MQIGLLDVFVVELDNPAINVDYVAFNVELPLRVGLLVGFLIVLSIEGWLLIRVLVN